jgi:prepilin-type N-terminal cleavage/methylation domain-containing protein
MSRGFTLLEVIVATLIFSMVIAAAYALLDSARTLTDQAEFQATMQQEIRFVLDTLRTDLRGVIKPSQTYDTFFTGTQSGGVETPLSTLDIVSVNQETFRSTAPSMDLTHTTYSVDEKETTEQSGLVRRRLKQLTMVDQNIREEEDLDEIGPHVAYVLFRYYDGSSWTETWSSQQSGKLPRAIEVTIHTKAEWRGEERTETVTEKIYLPLAAETPSWTP